jgi:hypothetical protein
MGSTEVALTIRCAWCGRTLKRGKPRATLQGDPSVPAISHGICKNCFARERVVLRTAFDSMKPSA